MSTRRQIQGTSLTEDDVFLLGLYLLNHIAGSIALGHQRITDSVMYVEYPDNPMGEVIRDVIWSCQFTAGAEVLAARHRLTTFVWESGWMRRQGEAAGRIG